MAERITNAEFAKKDKNFQKACELVNAKATTRQASKFRNGKGAVKKGIIIDPKIYDRPKNGS